MGKAPYPFVDDSIDAIDRFIIAGLFCRAYKAAYPTINIGFTPEDGEIHENSISLKELNVDTLYAYFSDNVYARPRYSPTGESWNPNHISRVAAIARDILRQTMKENKQVNSCQDVMPNVVIYKSDGPVIEYANRACSFDLDDFQGIITKTMQAILTGDILNAPTPGYNPINPWGSAFPLHGMPQFGQVSPSVGPAPFSWVRPASPYPPAPLIPGMVLTYHKTISARASITTLATLVRQTSPNSAIIHVDFREMGIPISLDFETPISDIMPQH